jgi:exodeoxyribonuclease V gamma subunit
LRDPTACPDWAALARGRGLLPAGSGGVLESQVLSQRWSSLETALAQFGEPRQETVAWSPPGAAGLRFEAMLQWRGAALMLFHTASARPGHRLELWLQALLAAAAGTPPHVAVLVGRDQDRFKAVERLRPLEPGTAARELQRLIGWRGEHRDRCWPVPPRMGLEFAIAERKKAGSGDGSATQAWEGGYRGVAEREQPEMALCFGACPASDLLEGRFGPFRELALALHGPRLEAMA